MSYESITFKDKNPVKRYLQRKRLLDALKLANTKGIEGCVVDYGAGNGELCKQIEKSGYVSELICFEPAEPLMKEAQANLSGHSNIIYIRNVIDIPDNSVDCVFCLEVFEHLPVAETRYALSQIKRILKGSGIAVIGVPVEIHLSALFKGVFRMCRRYGAFDATIKHVFQATLGFPPKNRPLTEIAPNLAYHTAHMGFDYRILLGEIGREFDTQKVVASPHPLLGRWLGTELNILITKA